MSESAEMIDRLLDNFGGTWPPKPEFTEWPGCWLSFAHICDEMSTNLLTWNNPAKFRKYLEYEFSHYINLEAVMAEIEARVFSYDPKLFGFLGCLAVLKNAYRWGCLPATLEEQARTTLVFPEILDKPVTRICNHYGIKQVSHVFCLMFANTIYDPEDPELPVKTRFHFNINQEILETEENFYILFTHSEVAFRAALLAMRDYMEVTNLAKQSRENAISLVEKRVEHLKTISASFRKVGTVFMQYAVEKKIKEKYWSQYAQSPATWGLDGNGGASGEESIIFQTLDEFLQVPGEGFMYENKSWGCENMPTGMRDILKALRTDMPDGRFDSFLNLPKEDHVLDAKDAILNAVYLWRLNHAHVARRYLKGCATLASSLERKMDLSQGNLAEVTYDHLRDRAREVAAQMTKNKDK